MTERPSKQSSPTSNIEVFIRIRPFTDPQTETLSCIASTSQKQISLRQKQTGEAPSFAFDRIFDDEATQEDVYNQVTRDMVDNAFQGINGSVFCYGQTSSGKTYTCIGSDLRDLRGRGILPRVIDQILVRCQSTPKHIECKMKISMIEIYNEKIKDLLDSSKHDLKIRSDKSRGIFVQNVTQKYIITQEEASLYISKGIENRSVGYTNMNAVSSRSHMLFIITVHQHDFYTGEARAAKITLVDLAGSEKLSRTGAEGKVLEEAKKINTSLSVLGKVINILSEGKKSVHVPFRDSKLTRLLQESLGGNSITKLIINISPDLINEQQTLSSLRFGFRAKSIKNQPRINKEYTVTQLLDLLHRAQRKIKILTDVIKEIMREKGQEEIGFKEFVKLYLKDTEKYAYQSGESDQERPMSLVKSLSGNFLLKREGQDNTHMKSFSGEVKQWIQFNSKTIPKQKPNPELSNTQRLQPETKRKTAPGHQSMVNIFRSTNIAIQTPLKKHLKNKSFSREGSQDREVSIKVKDNSDSKSFVAQEKIEIKKENSNSNGNQNGHNTENQTEHEIFPEQNKHHFFSLNSPDGRSILGSLCTLNSKVLDLSLLGNEHGNEHGNGSQADISSISAFPDLSMDVSAFEEGTVEFNIQKIRFNLRSLRNLKMKSFLV